MLPQLPPATLLIFIPIYCSFNQFNHSHLDLMLEVLGSLFLQRFLSQPLRTASFFAPAALLLDLFIISSCQEFNGAEPLYLPQSVFTYSTVYTSNLVVPLDDARLESQSSWSPSADDADPWIIVDFQKLYAVHGVTVKKCFSERATPSACHPDQPSMKLRAFSVHFSRDGITWDQTARFCPDCIYGNDLVTEYLDAMSKDCSGSCSWNHGPVVARFVKIDSFVYTGCCHGSTPRSLRLGFLANNPSEAGTNNAACVSARNCFECMDKSRSANCNWLTPVGDSSYPAGVCVGAADGLTLNYPYYTPNQRCKSNMINCVTSNGQCFSSLAKYQCSYDTRQTEGSPVTCKQCLQQGCTYQSNFVSTSTSSSQNHVSGKCVSTALQSPSCGQYLYYYKGSGMCQPRTNLRIPQSACDVRSPTFSAALNVPTQTQQVNPTPVPSSPEIVTRLIETDSDVPSEDSHPALVFIPFVFIANLSLVISYCKRRGIQNTSFLLMLSVIMGPLVWFFVVDEAKQIEMRSREQQNAELCNPYSQPSNPFHDLAHYSSNFDPDIAMPPPPNPYTSTTSAPRFDPDSAWAPPPNPYVE